MPKELRYGLEQARSHLPLIAREAEAGYATVITRHGEPVAVMVPVAEWQRQQQAKGLKGSGLLALRGTGKGLWPDGAGQAVQALRDEWPR